jgi:hypothetical protein
MEIPDGTEELQRVQMDPAPEVGGGGGYMSRCSLTRVATFSYNFLVEPGHVFERMEPLLITHPGEAVSVAIQRMSSMLGS